MKEISKVRISSLLLLPLCILLLNTSTIIMRYYNALKYWILIVFVLGVIISAGKNILSNAKTKEVRYWLLCLALMWGSSIYSFSRASTVSFCISATIYTLLLLWNLRKEFFVKLTNLLLIFLILTVATVYLNAIIPNLMISKLSFLTLTDFHEIFEHEISRKLYSGIFCDRATAAFAMNIGFAICLGRYLNPEKRKRVYMFLMAFFYCAIFLTGKRTLAVIPIIMGIAISLFYEQSARKRNFRILFLAASIIGLIIISVIPSISAVFVRSTNTLESRTDLLWPVAIKMFWSNPLIGKGLNTYNNVMQQTNNYGGLFSNWSTNCHNIYIQLLGELGLIGAICIFITLWKVLKETIKYLKNTRLSNISKEVITISFLLQILWLVYGFTGNTFYYSSQLLCYILAFAMMEVYKNDEYIWDTDIS